MKRVTLLFLAIFSCDTLNAHGIQDGELSQKQTSPSSGPRFYGLPYSQEVQGGWSGFYGGQYAPFFGGEGAMGHYPIGYHQFPNVGWFATSPYGAYASSQGIPPNEGIGPYGIGYGEQGSSGMGGGRGTGEQPYPSGGFRNKMGFGYGTYGYGGTNPFGSNGMRAYTGQAQPVSSGASTNSGGQWPAFGGQFGSGVTAPQVNKDAGQTPTLSGGHAMSTYHGINKNRPDWVRWPNRYGYGGQGIEASSMYNRHAIVNQGGVGTVGIYGSRADTGGHTTGARQRTPVPGGPASQGGLGESLAYRFTIPNTYGSQGIGDYGRVGQTSISHYKLNPTALSGAGDGLNLNNIYGSGGHGKSMSDGQYLSGSINCGIPGFQSGGHMGRTSQTKS